MRQPHGLEIGGGGLRAGDARLDVAAHAAPDVDLAGEVDGQRVDGPSARPGCEVVARRPAEPLRPRRRRARGDGREEVRARHPDGGAGAAELRLGLRDVLVGDVDLRLERVQLRIVEDLPPLPAAGVVPRLRGLPLDLAPRRRRAGAPPCTPPAPAPTAACNRARRRRPRESERERRPRRGAPLVTPSPPTGTGRRQTPRGGTRSQRSRNRSR